MRRRSLLQRLAGALTALPGSRRLAGATPASDLTAPDEATLRALATSVLPASLGTERIALITDRFQAWLRAYRPGAELDHGYGHTRLQVAGPSPVAGHSGQLAALERAARAEGATFAQLSPEQQRDLVASALEAARVAELPERPDGRHVASDLMAFFFRSSEASDLCYGVAIGRDTCRGLPGSDEAPPPLKRSL